MLFTIYLFIPQTTLFVLMNMLPSVTLTLLLNNVVRINNYYAICTPAPNGTILKL